MKMQKHKQKMIMQKRKQKLNADAEAEEVERTCTGTMMNDSVETKEEAGERHPGLHTVNGEAGRIVFHTEHVEHDMNDDTSEKTKTMHNTRMENRPIP